MQTLPKETTLLLPEEGPQGAPGDHQGPSECPQGAPSFVEVQLRCRDAFVPTDPSRQELISADFSQIEMRVLVGVTHRA